MRLPAVGVHPASPPAGRGLVYDRARRMEAPDLDLPFDPDARLVGASASVTCEAEWSHWGRREWRLWLVLVARGAELRWWPVRLTNRALGEYTDDTDDRDGFWTCWRVESPIDYFESGELPPFTLDAARRAGFALDESPPPAGAIARFLAGRA